jgi:hypothetical protein
MVSSIQPIQLWQYKLSFDVKIRNAYGTAFQDFFSTVMEKLHGDDFVRVRSFGSLGDKGCDGYLSSNGQVFQCYGKLEDAPPNAAGIVKKLEFDYGLAAFPGGGDEGMALRPQLGERAADGGRPQDRRHEDYFPATPIWHNRTGGTRSAGAWPERLPPL